MIATREIPVLSESERLIFWIKVNRGGPRECWLWTGPTGRRGYGSHRIREHTYKAHRVAYSMTRGTIPTGLLIRHTCDNPPCVNPSHLIPGTHADNLRDCHERGRVNQVRGERAPRAKLTAADVMQIRRLHPAVSGRELGRRFGVSHASIQDILSGQSWAHVREAQ